MKWTLASEKNTDGFKLARIKGEDVTFPSMFAPHVICDTSGKTYLKEDIEWLDTSSPSFTIDNMRDAFYAGKHAGDIDARFWNTDSISRNEYDRTILEFEQYLKSEYNIDTNE
jgi:hypothetical protein